MIYDIYSKRIEKENSEDKIYAYDDIPKRLRLQVYYIIQAASGNVPIWSIIRNVLLREYGIEYLVEDHYDNHNDCKEFIKNEESVNKFLDFIEVGFRIINTEIRKIISNQFVDIEKRRLTQTITQCPDEAIKELNHRFKENNFGYEFIDGQIIRIDRKYTHNEIVKCALSLLNEEDFQSANEEFITAHKYYKEGCSKENPNEDFKNAIINCNKAFESTMKIICERKLVDTYDSKHDAKKLINDLLDANIIPRHLENNFHGLKNILKGIKDCLENGLPVIRNKVGHGKGTEEEWVSEEFVTYSINLAATNIVLLVNLYKQL